VGVANGGDFSMYSARSYHMVSLFDFGKICFCLFLLSHLWPDHKEKENDHQEDEDYGIEAATLLGQNDI
jgi:hypothetical protein